MNNPLTPFPDARGFAVLDGGLATALEERGHRLDTSLWSARLLLDAPDEIGAGHRAYLEAGADCITTASYQASFPGLEAAGLGDAEAEACLVRSVHLALDARDDFASERGGLRPLVAASVGPYGAYLADGSEYRGRYGVGRGELDHFHRRRFELLAASGADLIACETLPSAAEAEVLLGILDDVPGVWAWMSFACADASRLADGTPFVDAVGACSTHERVAAVGVNCTHPRFVAALLERAAEVTTLPLIAYPNSGEKYDATSRRWSGDAEPSRWLEGVETWLAAGARVIGGCCRVGPSDIRHLRARLVASRGGTGSLRDES